MACPTESCDVSGRSKSDLASRSAERGSGRIHAYARRTQASDEVRGPRHAPAVRYVAAQVIPGHVQHVQLGHGAGLRPPAHVFAQARDTSLLQLSWALPYHCQVCHARANYTGTCSPALSQSIWSMAWGGRCQQEGQELTLRVPPQSACWQRAACARARQRSHSRPTQPEWCLNVQAAKNQSLPSLP